LGCTRSEVVMAWLAGGTPAVRPIIGVSRIEQLQAALRGARLELGELRQRLDAAW
jgi:aryl-alcohol dehydrogenase-like predicted oxidoreductase